MNTWRRAGWMVVAMLVLALGMTACDSGGGGGGGDHPYRGTYTGRFTGTDVGTWRFVVDGRGAIDGTAHSTLEGLDYVVSGEVDRAGIVSAGLYDGGIYRGTYEGAVNADGVMAGTWRNQAGTDRGTFTGRKQ